MSNMTKIAPGIYLVRTQAGFRAAIQDCFSEYFGDWKWMMKNRMFGFPTSYPSVVSLSVGYRGDTVFACNSVHVNELQRAMDSVFSEGVRFS